jgi:signal transduction histidine kinase
MLMPEPHQTHHDSYLHNYHTTGQARIIGIGREVEGRKKDGSTFPFRLAVSQVELKGKLIYTGIIHDLTSVKEAENQVLQMNQQLEQKVRSRTEQLALSIDKLVSTNELLEHEVKERKAAEAALCKSLSKEKELNELKSRFVSMASHEFRTPLSSILSSAELIKEYTAEVQQPNREKHVSRILASVDNLTNILNDFLSLGKLEEGAILPQVESFSISTFCAEVLDEFQVTLKADQRIVQHHNIAQDLVRLDRRFLKNILFNLLSNAAKYSLSGTTINCTIATQKEQLMIQIADQGMGIPEEDQQHLFSRFFRSHNAENIQGTGLGLHIVKRYLDMMGGEISFASEVGVGTTFFVSLPIKQNL